MAPKALTDKRLKLGCNLATRKKMNFYQPTRRRINAGAANG
jgi:hypothetical protein